MNRVMTTETKVLFEGKFYYISHMTHPIHGDIAVITPITCGTCEKYHRCKQLENSGVHDLAYKCIAWELEKTIIGN